MPATYEDRINGLTTSVAVKAPCRVATSSNLTLYGLQTVDGVLLEEGMRVLVRAQTIGVDNGIYCASAGAWSRALDFDGNRDVVYGTMVYVTSGALAGQYIVTSDDDPIDVGTSYIMITIFYRNGDRVPTVQSLAELRAMDPEVTPTVYLIDENRAALFGWDATVTPDWAALDPEEFGIVLLEDGADGAWVDAMNDRRRGFWTNSAVPARHGRFRSGLKVGDAATYQADTDTDSATSTWLSEVDIGWMQNGLVLAVRSAGSIAGTFASKNSGTNTANAYGIMVAAYNENTNTLNPSSTQAIYAEGISGIGHTGNSAVGEFESVNLNSEPVNNGHSPYSSVISGFRYGLSIASGGAHPGTLYDIDVYLRFVGNGARAKNGIVFRGTSLARAGDANTGLAEAIGLGQTHAISWYSYAGGSESFRMYANIDDSDNAQSLTFGDSGLFYRQLSDSHDLFRVMRIDNAANYLEVSPAVTGEPVRLRASGDDTDVDLLLDPKGAGVLQIGQALETTGTMTINRRLKVRDAAGNFFWLLGTNAD